MSIPAHFIRRLIATTLLAAGLALAGATWRRWYQAPDLTRGGSARGEGAA